MNSRLRSIEAILGRTPDRVPCVPLIDNSYSAKILGVPVSRVYVDPICHAESLVACLERHPGIDGLSINICLCDDIILGKEEDSEGYFIETLGGLTWRIPYNDTGTIKKCNIRSFDDPELSIADPMKPGIIQTLQAIPANIRSNYLINTAITGPFSQVAFLMGLNQVLLATIDNPRQLHKAIEKRLPLTYRWIEEMIEFNPACIWIGEGFASSSLISPKCYREFVLPYEQAVATKIHQYGIPCLLHICGKLEPIIEILPETGVDCIEVDWQVNMIQAKACVGDKIALKGNLNTTSLVMAGPEEIYKQSLELIQEASAGGGYILSSGCALGRDTPPENVDAMSQAVLDRGFY